VVAVAVVATAAKRERRPIEWLEDRLLEMRSAAR